MRRSSPLSVRCNHAARRALRACTAAAWCILGGLSSVYAEETPSLAGGCLPTGDGYLRARLAGALNAELHWDEAEIDCSGAVRPADGGVRMRFSGPEPAGGKLVLVFGIAALREGRDARLTPVNVTLMREGKGEFYSTLGDDKCMLDEIRQQPLVGIPRRTRSYRVVARGACTEPARAVRGEGVILLSRFDFAGRVDFEANDAAEDDPLLTDLQ